MAGQTNWGAILVAYGVGVVGAVQVGRVAPAAEALRADMALGLTTLGWAVSLITLASAALGLVAGHLVVRRGPRRMLVLGTALLAASVLLSALASTAPTLLLVRVVEGAGYLGIAVAAPTLIAREAAPKDAPAALALWGTFFTLGLSVAAITGGWLSEWLGWRAWYGVNAGLLAAAAALAWWALPRDATASGGPSEAAPGSGLPAASWLLGAAFFGVTLLALALLSMLPPFLVAVRGFSPGAAGGVTGIVALASLAGSLAYGALANRLGQGRIVAAAVVLLLVAAVPSFSAGLPSSLGIASASAAVFGSGVLVAHVFASVPRLVVDPAKIGPANGVIAQLGSVGALSGPPMVGHLVSETGWLALSLLIAVSSAVFALLMASAERAAGAVEAA